MTGWRPSSSAENFASDGCCEMIFEQGRYAYDRPYRGFTALPEHFFPVIGNIEEDGEEFDCAVFIATLLEGVKYWVSNVERKHTSFSLQTATDRFYPDFICKLEDGRVLAVEYKNSRDYDLPDTPGVRSLSFYKSIRKNFLNYFGNYGIFNTLILLGCLAFAKRIK